MLAARYLAASPDPFDDRWYTGSSVVYMNDPALLAPDNALRIPTVWRAVNVLAGAIASLPIDIFRYVDPERPERGKRVATEEPWRNKLRRRPNRLQTSFRWRHHMVGTLLLGGNYYNQKVGFRGQPPQQLWPLDPERMRPAEIGRDGTLSYQYTDKSGRTTTLDQDQIVHIRGFSRDGIHGVSAIDVMRDLTSLALMNRTQRTSFVRNEMRPSVVVKHPGDLGDTARTVLQQGYQRAFGGPRRAGEVLVLDEGMDIDSFGLSSRDAQYIESERFLIEEFLRMIGVPGVLVGHADKTSTYASAEQFFQSFATHSVFPIISNIEQELTSALLGDEDDAFVEFNLNAMLRPDSAARAAFYRVMVEMGILTRNEVRALENRNPLEGLDDPLTPKNMGTGAEDSGQGRASAIVLEVAARLVRKEIAGVQALARRHAGDAGVWRKQLAQFYQGHADLLRQALKLEGWLADAYAARQCAEAESDLSAIAKWQEARPRELATLALALAV